MFVLVLDLLTGSEFKDHLLFPDQIKVITVINLINSNFLDFYSTAQFNVSGTVLCVWGTCLHVSDYSPFPMDCNELFIN